MPHLKTDSLAFHLLGAARAVAQVRTGTALPQALSNVFAQANAPVPARGAMQDIAYRALRRLGRTEALLKQLTNKPPAPLLHALLCCALALISDPDDTSEAPYEAFTVVDQAVNAAAAERSIAAAKGMVNAVLRRFLRERNSLLENVLKHPQAKWNYSTWWIDAVRVAYPDQWQAILQVGNTAPPMTLRVNRRKTTVEDYCRRLAEHQLATDIVGPYALRLKKPLPVTQIPGFAEGFVSVQDAAAQLAAPLLDLHDGMRVLDACAAPGGKSGHILEWADVALTALDSDAKRLTRITENLQRLQCQADLKVGDASARDWWDGQAFDRILADVPCTASGIVRRHPDIRWLRRRDDAAKLATLSSRILDNLWQLLKPNGKLLLATCSLWPEESEAQATAFAARHNATRLPAPGQLLPTAKDGDDHDGLYYALFQKTAA